MNLSPPWWKVSERSRIDWYAGKIRHFADLWVEAQKEADYWKAQYNHLREEWFDGRKPIVRGDETPAD